MSAPMITADELRASISFEDLIEPVSQAFQAASARRAESGLVVMYPQEARDRGDVYVKTGTLIGAGIYIVKVSPWFAENVERGEPQGGFIAAFESRTGRTLALIDEQHYLSDIRTAAAGALAARVLAPAKVHTATVLGSGVQAYWQVLALFHERPFERLTIWARDVAKAEALRARLEPHLCKVAIIVIHDVKRAISEADVILTTTQAREPILRGEWLRAGQHITAVGADDPRKCELDAQALMRARVFVDSIDTTVANGDVFHAIRSGDYSSEKIEREIGDVLSGKTKYHRADADITIAKFVGIGAQDLAATEASLQILGARSKL